MSDEQCDVVCTMSNIIYAITCLDCGLMYVGETQHNLRRRFYKHRSDIRNQKTASCVHLCKHFAPSSPCSSYKVSIIRKLKPTGDTKKDTQVRQNLEAMYIKILGTKYPYGLNEDFKGENYDLTVMANLNIAGIHYKYATTEQVPNNSKRGRRRPREYRRQYWNDVGENLHNNIYSIKQIFHLLLRAPKNFFYKLNGKAHDNPTIMDMADDIFNYRFPFKKKSKPDKEMLLLKYCGSLMEKINLPRILNLSWVKEQWPEHLGYKLDKFHLPRISYTYDVPFGVTCCNYKQFVTEEIDNFDDFCDCSDSRWKDPHFGHVVTGNLDIIDNPQLKQIMARGFKYRPSKQYSQKQHNS